MCSISPEDFFDEYHSLLPLMDDLYLKFYYNLKIILIQNEKIIRHIYYNKFKKIIQKLMIEQDKTTFFQDEKDELSYKSVIFENCDCIYFVESDELKKNHYSEIKANRYQNYLNKICIQSLFGKDNTELYPWDIIEFRNPFSLEINIIFH